jgi:hypothetical protein
MLRFKVGPPVFRSHSPHQTLSSLGPQIACGHAWGVLSGLAGIFTVVPPSSVGKRVRKSIDGACVLCGPADPRVIPCRTLLSVVNTDVLGRSGPVLAVVIRTSDCHQRAVSCSGQSCPYTACPDGKGGG